MEMALAEILVERHRLLAVSSLIDAADDCEGHGCTVERKH